MMRFRPRGQMTSDQAAFYSPQRDLAHIGPSLFAASCSVLFDPAVATKEQIDYMVEHNITQDEVVLAVQTIQTYFHHAKDPAVKTIEEAMGKAGIESIRLPVRMLVFSRVGQVITGLMFPFIRQMNAIETKTTFGRLDELFSDVVTSITKQTK